MFKVTIPSSMTSDSLKSIDNMSEQLMLLSVSLDSNKVALVAASAYLVNACAAAGNLNE